ncbi:hypothetical protein HFO56_33955 [Rhizobium laguerreae]|uniref:hypothetical protein n=1 Tax=Rhizobium laguerreae TaxID=1076926 RepID=UPI001C901705|nr:hypothetical protein [Rhizobium laguerreae]MBY3157332.1 hypothetical protein [Rhizobium laguerreae]
MAKNSVVEIHLFGRVDTDLDTFESLSNSGSLASFGVPWTNGYEYEQFIVELEKAQVEKRAITFQIHDNWDVFEGLRANCQAAGLSYVAYTAEAGETGWSGGISWRPGMNTEFEFSVRGENAEPMIPANILRAAQNKGPEAVAAMLEALSANTEIGVIEIAEDFSCALAAAVASQPNVSPARRF